jgi:hypothetical protein
MSKTTENQTGGPAAQTPNINPQPDPSMPSDQNQDEPLPLKKAADKFGALSETLKKNIKAGKLPALQKDSKSPYLVNLSDVEKLLRDTPGIASIFHPAACVVLETPMTLGTEAGHAAALGQGTGADELPARPAPVAAAAVAEPLTNGTPAAKPTGTDGPPEGSGRKRRPRHRGKGRSGQPQIPDRPLFLTALAGTTPSERLKITACLNELAAMVASS